MTGHAEVGCEGRLGEVARHTERALHTLQYRKNNILKIKTLTVLARLPTARSRRYSDLL
jgi:hypothetical protein